MFSDHSQLSRRRFLSQFRLRQHRARDRRRQLGDPSGMGQCGRGPDQGRHRHRSHRPDRLCRQRRRQCRENGGEGDQRRRRPAGPAAGIVHRGHRIERIGGGRQRPQADPARQGRSRARRHHQFDAQRHQGRDRRARQDALYLPAALRGQGMHALSVLYRPDAGAAVRRIHSLADQERRQEVRAAQRQLRLAAYAERLCAQGDRGQRRRGHVRGILPARPDRFQRDRQPHHLQQGGRGVQHRDPARRRAVLQAALRSGLPQERRPAVLRLLRREHAQHQPGRPRSRASPAASTISRR